MDTLSPEQRRRCMQGNKRKDTKPELMLRHALRGAGFPGYRLQWKVPGRPDIAYPGRRIAIFVNGCFWHRCPYCSPPLPSTNVDFWNSKFEANVARDLRNAAALRDDGWTVVTVWECQVRKDMQGVIERLSETLRD